MTDDRVLRAAEYSDIPDIARLLDAASRRWTGRPTSDEQVRERLDTPGTDASRDTVVAAGPEIVGFGHLWPAPPNEIRCLARTHPDHRGTGIGTRPQGHLISRAAGPSSQKGGAVRSTQC